MKTATRREEVTEAFWSVTRIKHAARRLHAAAQLVQREGSSHRAVGALRARGEDLAYEVWRVEGQSGGPAQQPADWPLIQIGRRGALLNDTLLLVVALEAAQADPDALVLDGVGHRGFACAYSARDLAEEFISWPAREERWPNWPDTTVELPRDPKRQEA